MILSFLKNGAGRGTQRLGWWMLLVLASFLANWMLTLWVEQQAVSDDHVELIRHRGKPVGEL